MTVPLFIGLVLGILVVGAVVGSAVAAAGVFMERKLRLPFLLTGPTMIVGLTEAAKAMVS